MRSSDPSVSRRNLRPSVREARKWLFAKCRPSVQRVTARSAEQKSQDYPLAMQHELAPVNPVLVPFSLSFFFSFFFSLLLSLSLQSGLSAAMPRHDRCRAQIATHSCDNDRSWSVGRRERLLLFSFPRIFRRDRKKGTVSRVSYRRFSRVIPRVTGSPSGVFAELLIGALIERRTSSIHTVYGYFPIS